MVCVALSNILFSILKGFQAFATLSEVSIQSSDSPWGPVQVTLLWIIPVTDGKVVSVLLSLLPGTIGQGVFSQRDTEEGENGI